jgi:RNA polymerase sigma-70 factor (ECF subfamily)
MDRDEASGQIDLLFDSWYPSVVRYAWRAAGDFGRAEDIVQEAFMALYREFRRGTEIHNPKAWVLCVVRRQIGKSRDRTWETLQEVERLPAPVVETEPEIEIDSLTEMLSVLTPREEEVLLLRLSAMKYREIAAQLGISGNSVNTLLARAIQKLQKAAGRPPRERPLTHSLKNGVSKTLQ